MGACVPWALVEADRADGTVDAAGEARSQGDRAEVRYLEHRWDVGVVVQRKSLCAVDLGAEQDDGAQALSLYNDSDVPAVLEVADFSAVTLGTRFASSVDGTVSAIRFYKGPGNTGTHVGALWAVGTSTPLAEATFTAEGSMGWQTVEFATPVNIAKDTEYIASYSTTVGKYSATLGAFSGTGVQRSPLRTAPDSGAYSYAGGYPGSRSSTSYFVDVVFTKAPEPLAVLT